MVATVQVTCIISNQEGNPSAGATITALLSGADVDQVSGGYVLPELITGTTNSSGICVLALWPNQLGSLGTQYVVTITDPVTSRTTTINATIPNANCRLDLVANLPTYPVVAQAQLAINAAIAQVAPAINAANEATTAAATATSSAILATTQAGNASASASAAATSAAAAAASAAAAAASGGTGSVTASSIGLGNVNNTSDANKPVSTAQAAANAAVLASAESFTTSQIAALTPTAIGLGNVNNTSDANKPVSTAQAAANAVVLASAESFTTSQIAALTPASVGLSNVNNTSDANKPVSTLQQTAIASAISSILPYKTNRGIGQAMSPSIQGYTVGAGIAQTFRSRHYEVIRFREFQACLQCFAPLLPSNGIVKDFLHPFGLNFQVGFEPIYANSVSGLGPRKLLTFSGSTVATYAYIPGVSVNQNSNAITCSNILGNIAVGQPVFYQTQIIGYIESWSGTTSITLKNNYTGPNLSGANCSSNNGANQQEGIILSDPFDPGSYYTPSGNLASPNFFGLHTTVENPTQNVITGATVSNGGTAFTCTSVSGNGFGIGSPVFNTSGQQICTVTGVTTAGSAYTVTAATAALAGVTAYAQGLPYQRNASNFLNKYVGITAVTANATGTAGVTSNSNTVSITSGSGWAVGQQFNANTISAANTVPNGTYVTQATAASGTLTLTLNNNVTLVASTPVTGIQSNINQDTARSSTSYTASPNGASGSYSYSISNYFTPCMLVVQTNSALPFVMGLGDSITYGSDEGGQIAVFNGTIASNILTINSNFTGNPIVPGQNVYTAGNVLACTIGTNISGAGNGSTWNVTTYAGGTAVPMCATINGLSGDTLGSALGNSGWLERGLRENVGYPMVNLSRGSDANYMLATSANWMYRQQILAAANPTHVVSANIHNDIGAQYNTVASAWTANTAYTIGSVISNSGAVSDYVLVGTTNGSTTGVSGASAPTGTVYGTNYIDGNCVWQYLYPHIATTNSRGGTSCLGWKYQVNQKIRSIVPGANILGLLPTPNTTSTDLYATTANQTPTADGWGGLNASGTITTNAGSNVITVTAGGTNIVAGTTINAPGIPVGAYVQSLGTYSGGTGTLNLNVNATANGTGVSMTGFNSTRSSVYSMMTTAAIQTLVNWNGFLDLNTLWENGGSGQSDIFVADGVPYYPTYDGTHPTSPIYALLAGVVTSSAFASVN